MMNLFKNSIGVRIGNRGHAGEDSIRLEELLKFKTNKFRTIIMNALQCLGVMTKPLLIKGMENCQRQFVYCQRQFVCLVAQQFQAKMLQEQ